VTPERVRVGPLHQRPLHRLREPAVANAHPDVVAAADEVTASNDQDGVVLVLAQLAIRKLTAKPASSPGNVAWASVRECPPDAAWAETDELRVAERSNPQIKSYVRPEEAAEKGVKAVLSRDDIGRHLTSEMFFSGDRLPGFSDTIEHPDGLVLVDTGMIDTTPAIEDDGEEWHPNPLPDELVSRVAVVVNTHLHFDHCGGNRLFPGIAIHVQRRELADARTKDDYTVREWVDFPGATYVEHDGEAEILPGVKLLPAPGHTAGHQVVVVETDEGSVVLAGDVGDSFEELERGDTPGRQLVLELAAPTYLAHVAEVRVPHPRS
jgi:N-acyl homoserine lactone hydrolase